MLQMKYEQAANNLYNFQEEEYCTTIPDQKAFPNIHIFYDYLPRIYNSFQRINNAEASIEKLW